MSAGDLIYELSRTDYLRERVIYWSCLISELRYTNCVGKLKILERQISKYCMKDLIETFEINNRINLSLLAAIDEEYLEDGSGPSGRNVGEQLAHLHNTRLLWLRDPVQASITAPVEINALEMKITKRLLKDELSKSGHAIQKMLETCFASGVVPGFKPSPAAFVGYLVAHESYHRGQIMLLLKQCGHPIGITMRFGLHNVATDCQCG
jgi:uncharacterized damage-inducible protein DinB